MILLIDDDADDRELFGMAIHKLEKKVAFETLPSAEDALTWLDREVNPDFIFLDYNMPGMSGPECLQHLKSDDKLKHIPVLMYSTSNNPLYEELCRSYGAAHYIVKPVKLMSLVNIIEDTLKGQLRDFLITEKQNNL